MGSGGMSWPPDDSSSLNTIMHSFYEAVLRFGFFWPVFRSLIDLTNFVKNEGRQESFRCVILTATNKCFVADEDLLKHLSNV